MSKIVVAEDSSAMREVVRIILESRGHQVIEANDGQEALERIEEAAPDLVILDIEMPALDGFGVMRRLRQNLRFAALPVVAITGATKEDRDAALRAGFNGLLRKPFSRGELIVALQEFLELDRSS